MYQRPQHLLSRCAAQRRVFFVEEPVFKPTAQAYLDISTTDGVTVVVPTIPDAQRDDTAVVLRPMVSELLSTFGISRWVAWYYTPAAVAITRHLTPDVAVYDCMDELSLFAAANPALTRLEDELLQRADIVFTGGPSLYASKSKRHPGAHLFPSSVDVHHFSASRHIMHEPFNHAAIARPRIGFYGVIDERLDINLLDGIALRRPDWSFVVVGPVVKIDPAGLPMRQNLHYLGPASYEELPSYLAAWDLTMMPFARNDATRFISPTKTLEYLAAHKRVVATAIADVVEPYGRAGVVQIVSDAEEFIARADTLLKTPASPRWRRDVDRLIAATSWDRTWTAMWELVEEELARVPLPFEVA